MIPNITLTQNTEELTKVLGFTTREVTLIGFLLVAIIVLCYTVYRLYKDKSESEIAHSKEVAKERNIALEVLKNNNEALNKVSTTLEIIKEKISS